MRAQDVDRAMTIFRNSTLPSDAFHKQCWKEFTEQHEVLMPIFHAESEAMKIIDIISNEHISLDDF